MHYAGIKTRGTAWVIVIVYACKILDHAHLIIGHAYCFVACKVQQVRSKKIVAIAARMCNRRGWRNKFLSIAPVVDCQ